MTLFFEIIAILVLGYVAVVFGIARLIVPNLEKVKIPKKIRPELKKAIEDVHHRSNDSIHFIQNTLDLFKERFSVRKHQSFLTPWILFRSDANRIWEMGGNQACTVLNMMLKTFLVHSGRFKEEDVQDKQCVVRTCIHQYLRVLTEDGRVILVDPWGYLCGRARLGEYAHGWLMQKENGKPHTV